jgi:serine protein kinase
MDKLEKIGNAVQSSFQAHRRVLSYGEYLALLQDDPRHHARGAAQYVRDMFDHFGTTEVAHPDGPQRRFTLFDAPWDDGEQRLVGEEEVQNAIYRVLNNFIRQRRVERFILLHGPNGSSKSTITELVARGMEQYSELDEGAIYCFNWIFPTQNSGRKGIGFADKGDDADVGGSYAYLEDGAIDARLSCELHDHPLLLLPQAQREALLHDLLSRIELEDSRDEFILSEYVLNGGLCHKCKLIYEALLNAHQGDYLRVLRHVQVERFFISRRYRRASSRVEPQLAVDAKARQVTADRSLSALPTSLQSCNLFELDGDLVQANRGTIDYPDLLKRPVEAYKYLITTVEDGRVVLDQTNVFFDLVFTGSSNDMHLNAFKESPEWMSFKARMELVSVPYLLDHTCEREIYDEQVNTRQVGKHIAPHTTAVAALWAVLTRMHRPEKDRYEEGLGELVAKLTPLDKAELYAEGKLPKEVKGEQAKLLRSGISTIWNESQADVIYEGCTGASPREVRTAIMNAAQDKAYGCLSPSAVLSQLSELVKETSVYAFLRQKGEEGFYEHADFVDTAEGWYLDHADDDLRTAMGLVEDASYQELFTRYITHLTHYVSKEKLHNPHTGAYEEADEKLMGEVEKELGIEVEADEFRNGLMTKIGAWSVDNKGEKPDYPLIFPDHFDRLSSSYYESHRQRVKRNLEDALRVLSDEGGVEEERRERAEETLARLQRDHGYCEHCAREAITLLFRARYAD